MKSKSYNVLIDLGKLKKLYSGLGQFSLQFGNILSKTKIGHLDLNYLVPGGFNNKFGESIKYEELSLQRRLFPSTCKKYDVWHAIHQDSRFFPSDKETPYILTIHDLNFLEEKGPIAAKRRLSRLQKKVDRACAITFISNYTAEIAKENLDFKNKITEVIYNGVDIDTNICSPKPDYLPEGKYLFTIGMILEKKNFLSLINFIKLLPEYNLIIAGDDSHAYAKGIGKKITEYGLSNHVVLPGIISEEDKTYLYKNCEAFLFPSKMEGFGLPVIEAMRFGKPVFCSKLSSLPEIGGDVAYYWENFNPVAMKAFFKEKMVLYKKGKSQIVKNTVDFSHQYEWDKSIASYILLYQKVLAEKDIDIIIPNDIKTYKKPIKILHLSTEKSWRGGEQQIAYLIEELNKLNVKNHIVCHLNSMFEDYCKDTSLKYKSLKFNSPYNLLTAYQIAQIVNLNKIDILHMHTSVGHTVGVLSTLFNHNAKLVLARRVDFPINKNLLSAWKYNHKRIKKIIAVSKAIQSIINKNIVQANRTTIIHDGVNISRFDNHPAENYLRKKYKVDDGKKLIGNASALADHKDYFTFINTAEHLVKKNIKATFFIIGDGPEKRNIQKYILSKNLSRHIIMTGFLSNITDVLPGLDIFLMTSKTEGLGTSVLDAFACGVPVVATRAGGIPEMVIHERTGLLSDIKNYAQLSDNIIRLINDPILTKKLITNAKKFLESEFSKEIMAKRTLKVYKSIISGN